MTSYIKSRKKTQRIFYAITSVFIFLFFALKVGGSAINMYLICMGLGFGSGVSVLYITMSAEQFGTHLRATASISNFVRGPLPLILFLFQVLRIKQILNNYVTAAWVTGTVIMIVGFISALYTPESFGRDLDFVEK